MNATVQVSNGGRVIIPAKVRHALHLEDGTRLLLSVQGQELHLVPVDLALDELQTQASRLLKGSPSLADELITERRAESAHE